MLLVIQGHLSKLCCIFFVLIFVLSLYLLFVLSLFTIVWTFRNFMFSLRLLPSENTDNINTKTISFPFSNDNFRTLHTASFPQYPVYIFSDCCMLHDTKEMPLFPLGLLPWITHPMREHPMRDQQMIMAIIY